MNGKSKNIFKRSAFYVSLVMLVIAGVTQAETLRITQPDSRMLPQLVALLLFLCGAALLAAALLGKAGEEGADRLLVAPRQLLATAFLALFCVLAPVLGFYAALFLLVVGEGLLMLDLKRLRPRRLLLLLAGGLALTLVLSQAFIHVFRLVTPQGLLF